MEERETVIVCGNDGGMTACHETNADYDLLSFRDFQLPDPSQWFGLQSVHVECVRVSPVPADLQFFPNQKANAAVKGVSSYS